jgi:hypothetical protein
MDRSLLPQSPEVEAGLYQDSTQDIQLTQERCHRTFARLGD